MYHATWPNRTLFPPRLAPVRAVIRRDDQPEGSCDEYIPPHAFPECKSVPFTGEPGVTSVVSVPVQILRQRPGCGAGADGDPALLHQRVPIGRSEQLQNEIGRAHV